MMSITNRVLIPMFSLAALGLAVQANAYQVEVNGTYQNVDNDAADVDIYRLGGEFYFNNVEANSGPLKEAAFLEKASSVRATYEDLDTVDGIILGGRFVAPGSNMLLEAEVNTGDLDGWNLGAGVYIDDNSTVIARYTEVNDTTDGFGIEYKNVMNLNSGAYLNLEGSAEYEENDFDQDVTTFFVSGEYFFNKMASVGAGVGVQTGDLDATIFALNGAMFFTENFALEATLAQQEFDDFDGDLTTLAVSGTLRF